MRVRTTPQISNDLRVRRRRLDPAAATSPRSSTTRSVLVGAGGSSGRDELCLHLLELAAQPLDLGDGGVTLLGDDRRGGGLADDVAHDTRLEDVGRQADVEEAVAHAPNAREVRHLRVLAQALFALELLLEREADGHRLGAGRSDFLTVGEDETVSHGLRR